ncbi:MAG TPA: hypothetical protein VFE21_05685 [Rubrobacteraceae bacterium]|nr:hypothetical protein [Rubrobacteraceae bacterium]
MARALIGAGKTRHTRVLLAAVFGALLSLMRVSRGTWGSSLGEIGEAPEGASYIAGELPIVYETDVPSAAAEEVPEASGGEVEEEIPEIDAQLIEFPGVKDEPTERRRERLLTDSFKTPNGCYGRGYGKRTSDRRTMGNYRATATI